MTRRAFEPELAGVVVHWRGEASLERLLAAWPADPRFELVVVDNSRSLGALPQGVRRIDPGRNLGFAGGVNLGVAQTRAPIVLILNPDARPRRGALEAILAAFAELPDAAGVVPALVGPDGTPQHRWQLRRLPSAGELVLQTLFVAGSGGAAPPRGTPIEQPAAAALALSRAALADVGGLDTGFHPAWFEDVDLARRLARAGHRLLYEPRAVFVHELGSTVPALGYGPFLWIYYRNLVRYLRLHHGPFWTLLARGALPLGMLLRLLALPLRRPKRARGRLDAARGLGAVLAGCLSGWRRPRGYRQRFGGQR